MPVCKNSMSMTLLIDFLFPCLWIVGCSKAGLAPRCSFEIRLSNTVTVPCFFTQKLRRWLVVHTYPCGVQNTSFTWSTPSLTATPIHAGLWPGTHFVPYNTVKVGVFLSLSSTFDRRVANLPASTATKNRAGLRHGSISNWARDMKICPFWASSKLN